MGSAAAAAAGTFFLLAFGLAGDLLALAPPADPLVLVAVTSGAGVVGTATGATSSAAVAALLFLLFDLVALAGGGGGGADLVAQTGAPWFGSKRLCIIKGPLLGCGG